MLTLRSIFAFLFYFCRQFEYFIKLRMHSTHHTLIHTFKDSLILQIDDNNSLKLRRRIYYIRMLTLK